MFTTPVLVLAVVVLIILYVLKLNKEIPDNFPPGPPRLPFWGSYWYLLKENFRFSHLALETLGKKYKTKVLGFYLGSTPAICVFDTDLCKELLTRDEFLGKGDSVTVRARGQGKRIGIFFVDGLYWKDQRRFTLRHLRDFGFGRRSGSVEDFTSDQVRDMVDLLLSNPRPDDEDVCRSRGEVYMPEIFFGYYLNCIWYILSGRPHNLRKLREVARMAMGFQRAGDVLGGAISQTPWLRFIAPTYFGYTSAVEDNKNMFLYCKEIVEEHLQTFNDEHHRDFIDVYISEIKKLEAEGIYNTSFNIEQMTFIVMDYMFPAAVALGHTTNFYFGYLLNFPEVQTKIQKEIDEVVGKGRLPSLDDRKDMHYTEATIREIIRRDPANPIGLTRKCTEDTTLGGYFVPKDTIVISNVYTAHNDPEFYKEPEKFMPERWLEKDGTLSKKDTTMGFGAGKRLCAGETFARQTMFLFVTGLLQNFTFVPGNGEQVVDIVDFKKRIPGINLSIESFWMRGVPRT